MGVMPNPLTSRHTFGRLIVISPENGAILGADHYSAWFRKYGDTTIRCASPDRSTFGTELTVLSMKKGLAGGEPHGGKILFSLRIVIRQPLLMGGALTRSFSMTFGTTWHFSILGQPFSTWDRPGLTMGEMSRGKVHRNELVLTVRC
jgi:hypothetical protein